MCFAWLGRGSSFKSSYCKLNCWFPAGHTHIHTHTVTHNTEKGQIATTKTCKIQRSNKKHFKLIKKRAQKTRTNRARNCHRVSIVVAFVAVVVVVFLVLLYVCCCSCCWHWQLWNASLHWHWPKTVTKVKTETEKQKLKTEANQANWVETAFSARFPLVFLAFFHAFQIMQSTAGLCVHLCLFIPRRRNQ